MHTSKDLFTFPSSGCRKRPRGNLNLRHVEMPTGVSTFDLSGKQLSSTGKQRLFLPGARHADDPYNLPASRSDVGERKSKERLTARNNKIADGG